MLFKEVSRLTIKAIRLNIKAIRPTIKTIRLTIKAILLTIEAIRLTIVITSNRLILPTSNTHNYSKPANFPQKTYPNGA